MPPDAQLQDAVRAVMAASFDLDTDELPQPASQETVDAWTASAHLVLLLNLEQRFNVTFSLEQMMSMTSAERIAEVIDQIIGTRRRP